MKKSKRHITKKNYNSQRNHSTLESISDLPVKVLKYYPFICKLFTCFWA